MYGVAGDLILREGRSYMRNLREVSATSAEPGGCSDHSWPFGHRRKPWKSGHSREDSL